MHVVLYTKPDCTFCLQTKLLLNAGNIAFEEKVLDVDFTRQGLKESFPTATTYPVIVVDGFYVGGYNDFKTLLEQKSSDSRRLLNEG